MTAIGPARRRRRWFSRRDPLWFKVIFVLVVVPVAAVVIAPVVVFRRIRDFVRTCRYIRLDGTEQSLQRAAMLRAPVAYRWFGKSVSVGDIDATRSASPSWVELKSKIQPGDKIWPFTINPHTLAMRQGFVVVRRGKPVGVVVTLVS